MREPENEHSENASSVHSKKINQTMEIIGLTHQQSALGKAVHRQMSDWKILRKQKPMENIKVHQRKHGCLVKELRSPAFCFSMEGK